MCWYIATSYHHRWWELKAFVYYALLFARRNWETTCSIISIIYLLKKLFQDIRIELREASGEPAALEAGVIPTKVVLHFGRV